MVPRSPSLILLYFLTFTAGRFVLPQRNVTETQVEAAVAPRVSEDEVESAATQGPCSAFQLGHPTVQELYSPSYPHNYPNHSDCIRILRAEPGHLLRLDFRDEFHVEPSEDCRFDYLEVRDGEHGYSSLLGRFCGHTFPPMLTSSGRHLWLRFRSDENIEYSGFRAVFLSIPRPTSNGREVEVPPCRMTRGGVEGYVNRSDIPLDRVMASVNYNVPLDCMWVITVEEGWKINLMFIKFALERPNDCDSNFIDVFPERTDLPSRLHNFCGSIAEMVASRGSVLHVRFVADPKALNSSFEIVYTAFRERAKDEVCGVGEYDCEDATCISLSLRCNGRANCRFRWDEDECKSEVSALGRLLQEEHMVIIIIIFFMILSGMCSAFVYNCARKLVRDSQMIKEQIQSSFSGRENSICRKMPVATVLTPISTIVPGLGDLSLPSSGVPSPITRHTLCTNSLSGPCHMPAHPQLPCHMPAPPQLPCHVPAPQILNATTLQQHVSLDSFTVETVKYNTEVKDSECQTRESLFVFASMDSLIPPPPPPPPQRLPTVFLETDLDVPSLFPRPPRLLSRSHEHLPPARCLAALRVPRAAPDVIEAH